MPAPCKYDMIYMIVRIYELTKSFDRAVDQHILDPLALGLDPAGRSMMSRSSGGFPCIRGAFVLTVQIIIEKKKIAPTNMTNTSKRYVHFGFIASASHLLTAAGVCCPCLAFGHRNSADGRLACCVSNTITHLNFANKYESICMLF